jgi:hypothetical protein
METILDMVPGIFDIKVAKHIVQHGHYNIWILERVQTVWKSLRVRRTSCK